MNDEQIGLYFHTIRQQIAALQSGEAGNWEDIDKVLENLHVIFEQMQTNLDLAEVVEEELLQQNQQLVQRYHHYYDLFQALPIAYLVTDARGVILEANHAIAQLLKVPSRYLAQKPFILYVAEGDRATFRTKLNQLSTSNGIQVWQMSLCPRAGNPITVELHIDPVRNTYGQIENLQIGAFTLIERQQQAIQPTQQPTLDEISAEKITLEPSLPQSLDGLQVLVVEDEADAREFITVVLESHGICVRAVANAAAALEELKRFRPDVLVSDIRMPGGDGYSLIQQIRLLEASQGGHIPAAAVTAYIDEDREKALTAGFEAHLHKLAQPSELVQMVAQLARR